MKNSALKFLVLFYLFLFATVAFSDGPRVLRAINPDLIQIERNGERLTPISRGLSLDIGDSVVTGANAKLFLGFPNGDSAVIMEKSTVVIEEYSYSEVTGELQTRLRMNEGEIVADLENLKKNPYNPQFDVATKVGIAGIRGTQFVIRVRRDPATGKLFANFGVTRGEVFVELTGAAAAAATSVLNDVSAGQELVITGDVNDAGEVTSVDSINNIPITVETNATIRSTVQEIVTARNEEKVIITPPEIGPLPIDPTSGAGT